MDKIKKIFRKSKALWLILPAAFLTVVITAFTVLNTLRESLGYLPELSLYALDLSNYAELFGNRVFLNSLWYSFYVAAVSTLLCIGFGLMLGYLISRVKSPIIHMLYRLPIVLSYVAAGLLVYTTFSDYGVLYHLLDLIGIKTNGLNILFHPSGGGVILLNCFKGIPFMAMSTAPVFHKALKQFPAAAMNLGASRPQIIFRIILPLVKRSALTSALVLFNYQMFSYEGFYYLGSSTPVSLGVLSYQSYLTSDLRNRAACMAINSVMIGISLITSFLYIRAMRKDAVIS